MLNSHLHDFHFVMTRGMKTSLMGLDMYEERGSLSGIIVNIFSLLAPFIKKEHIWGEDRKSRYLPVCDDPDEAREHVHVYFPREIYRQLKAIHQDLNVYSIAQLTREILSLFLWLIKLYGKSVYQELNKIFKQWNEENIEKKQSQREILRQLRIIIQHLSGQTGLINIYNQQFSPFYILRL